MDEKLRRLAAHADKRAGGAAAFSYHSGERQTGLTLADIRADHVARYVWARDVIKAKVAQPTQGLDVFCGNGYGCTLLSEIAPVLGIDGSAEAIEVARTSFAGTEITYEHRVFPFTDVLPDADFIACLESLEHVIDAGLFFATLAKSLRPGGVLALSTPHEARFPHSPVVTPFHIRHFQIPEVLAMAKASGLRLVDWVGQTRGEDQAPQDPQSLFCDPAEGMFVLFAFQKP
ncbi:MAG: methyltransferase domain-containing protein [Pseudomonadota bacterium]